MTSNPDDAYDTATGDSTFTLSPPVGAESQHESLQMDSSAQHVLDQENTRKPSAELALPPQSPLEGQLSPADADRVFPIRSVISVQPNATPSAARSDRPDGYFGAVTKSQRMSISMATGDLLQSGAPTTSSSVPAERAPQQHGRRHSLASHVESQRASNSDRQRAINDLMTDNASVGSAGSALAPSDYPGSGRTLSLKSTKSIDETGPLVTARFKHVVSEGGHAIITGRDGDTLQRCEDEPIHIPGAVQGFGLLLAFEEQQEGRLVVRTVSENSKRLLGYTPMQLFALDSFTDILSEEQTDNLLDHLDFIRDEDADVVVNGPEVFTISIRAPSRKSQKFWCAMHINDRNPNLVICEFELEDDPNNPLVPAGEATPEPPEDTLNSQPTEEEFAESTQNSSKPLRVLRSARKRKGEAAAMEVFNIMSQVQEQLNAAPNIEQFLKILVGVVKELTGFHRVMIYQFDQAWNGRVVTELVDPRATKDLYKGLNFPASDIPKQARDLYKINKVRMLYDRDQETARLVCRSVEDLETPLDLTHSYLRAMSPIHLQYLSNMAVRSSMSISMNAFDELWGLIACHSYGSKGMRVSFPIRKMCRLVGDSASRNIERLSYASRLQARKLINTVPTQSNPSGYIIASSEDLLKLFDADFGLLSIRDETKILGKLEKSQEALAMLEYLRMRSVTGVMTSLDIREDFPDLHYPPGFKDIAGLLLVPLSVSGQDFIIFFRKGQLKEVKWAGNPYEKFVKEGTEGYLEPRKSFRTWSEKVVGKCREWTEEEIETAAVLCLVYGKFIEVWRQKEAAVQNTQLTRLLLANSAHEVRTPLNAIINYLEIALEGALDQETRDNLAKSHSASKSLIYVINDLLDLTKTEEGGDLIKKDEIFDPCATLSEATEMFKGDARRKNLTFDVTALPGVPHRVIGDQRRVRQAISNVTANAIENTIQGGVKVDMYVASRTPTGVEIEVSILDTGIGMSLKKLDALFRDFEQVSTEVEDAGPDSSIGSDERQILDSSRKDDSKTLGLGLAVVARIIRNMNGQLRLKSDEGKGSRFVINFPFDLPEDVVNPKADDEHSESGHVTPMAAPPQDPKRSSEEETLTLVNLGGPPRRKARETHSRQSLSRMNSNESFGSRNSRNSMLSNRSLLSYASSRSGKSEAERLIEAIQEPHNVRGTSSRGGSRGGSRGSDVRPTLERTHSISDSKSGGDVHSSRNSLDLPSSPQSDRPGEKSVTDQRTPVRPIRILDDFAAGSLRTHPKSIAGPPRSVTFSPLSPSTSEMPVTAENLSVLVAEDDPVNSRIIQKRLEKLGHRIRLTANGEVCSGTYCEEVNAFDIVLMDIQMPIVDGLTATKLIRSHEKAHPSKALSERAALNHRVPIIAVSASLNERDRQQYIDGGFDGWILKPISFSRLSQIMEGIVDSQVRQENLYQPGSWERGGWFEMAPEHDSLSADTKPTEASPTAFADPAMDAAAETTEAAAGGRVPSEDLGGAADNP